MRRLIGMATLVAAWSSACFPDPPKVEETSGDADTTVADTVEPETGAGDVAPVDTSGADTGGPDTSPADTGPADTSPADTSPADADTTDTTLAETSTPDGEVGDTSEPDAPAPDAEEVIVPECDGPEDCVHLTATCVEGACDGGACVARALTGTGCEDGDACTTDDRCEAGACGGTPVVCTARDQCHDVGVCDTRTGECSNPALSDIACDDEDPCTQDDVCSDGVCAGSAVACAAKDQCHEVGVCNPDTGVCSDPVRNDGVGCDDGDKCTQGDVCAAGVCGGSPVVCVASPNPCLFAYCDEPSGSCRAAPRADGEACDDRNACTTDGYCYSGVCVVSPISCVDLVECFEEVYCATDRGCVAEPSPTDTPCTLPDGVGSCRAGACGRKSLSLGEQHTCIRMPDDRFKCWGTNGTGVLGYGDNRHIGDDEAPSAVSDALAGAQVVDVAAFGQTTCVVLLGGDVTCFGLGSRGQLGLGPDVLMYGNWGIPTETVMLGSPVSHLAGGRSHVCAVLIGGNLQCWGAGDYGQLGVSSELDVHAPEDVGLVQVGRSVREVYAGAFRTCVITSSSTVRCWGLNDRGQLGYGHTENIGDDESPASAGDLALGPFFPAQLALSQTATCGLDGSGNVKCWGPGPLGYGPAVYDIGDNETPASVGTLPMPGPVRSIAANFDTVCAVLADDGSVRCWGSGSYGVMGPAEARQGDIVVVPLGETVEGLFMGGWHACAVTTSGAVRCWGANFGGQLGFPHIAKDEHIGDDQDELPPGAVDVGP